ncbi:MULTISPECIES: DUF6185 family protein [unclassified Streptomyces]|uniref:DUF6185 family protein n=1 Tax=unclassified Streptomyces TaxID=2593676 RepID=UPI003369BFF9
MMAIRWWRWLARLIVVVGWWAWWPTEAQATAHKGCDAGSIGKPSVDAIIQFTHHRQTFVQAHAITKVKVPMAWRLADLLTLSDESDNYRRAMRCLLRGNEGFPSPRPEEWRLDPPRVKAKGHWVTVHYEAYAWISKFGTTWIGPWQIEVRKGKDVWQVTLPQKKLPETLKKARWTNIEIRPGGLSVRNEKQKASLVNEKYRAWKGRQRPDVSVGLAPPWHASFALESANRPFWSRLGIGLWWVCGSAVFALAVLHTRTRSSVRPRWLVWCRQLPGRLARAVGMGPRAPRTTGLRCPQPRPATPPEPSRPHGRRPRWWTREAGREVSDLPTPAALLWWAGLSAGLGLTLALLSPKLRSFTLWQTFLGIAASLALIVGARPWGAITSSDAPQAEPDNPARRRWTPAHSMILTSAAVAVLGLLMVVIPQRFQLPAHMAPPDSGAAGRMVLQLVMVWGWLAAMAAWAWRFAGEGGLLPRSWRNVSNRAPGRCLGVAGALLGVVAVLMLVSYWRSAEINWRRATWLSSEHVHRYSSEHAQYLRDTLVSFGPTGLQWAYAYTWVLTDIALVALLNARAKAAQHKADLSSEQVSLGPSQNDMRLTSLVFAIVVATRQSLFAGSSLLLVVWLLLNIAALYAVRAFGRRWSVLSQAGGDFLTQALGTAQGRGDMLEKAHQYRNLHSQLRLVDQGHAEKGATREKLEVRLRRLRHWRPAGCDRDCLPDQVSVMDVALSWGPYDSWWDNARHAARLAFLFGIPASGAIVWATYLKGAKQLMQTNANSTALPEIVARFLTWQIAWAGAGLVLGALWRMLPGRRGPARALSLTVAYAIPIGVGGVVNRITDTELGNAILSASLMLIVLTLTSIAMDAATFSSERQLWPTRFSLLLSIYQMRALSVQLAYLVAQLAAAAGIWKVLAGGALNPH